jgi:saccharopine dehydrogenase (NAD+, L-lysine forming)
MSLRVMPLTILFSEIGELGTRDGSNLTVEGYDFAPSFSIWTTIEECLNPPVVWEADRGWYVTPPFSEPEVFDFPGGIWGQWSASMSSTRKCC